MNNNDDDSNDKRRRLEVDSLLQEKVNVLNNTYINLLKTINENEQYQELLNLYRNEEMDITMLLQTHKLSEDYLTKFKLNHIFKCLPLDMVNSKDLESDDEEEIGEESDATDEEYDMIEDAKKMFKQFLSGEEVMTEKKSMENTINECNLGSKEKTKLLEELKKVDDIRKNNIPDKLKVLQLDIPIEVKAELLEKMELLEMSTNDDSKTREWIKQVLKIPFGKNCKVPIEDLSNKEDINKFLTSFHDTLDKAIYGQNNLKESLVEIIAKWITSGAKKGNCIAISGAPGTGKTSIVRQLATALKRPFCSFSLAGVSDENYLTGFPFTYEGATCGRFAKMLMDSKCMNPIIFMDELDKVDTKKSMSVYNKLIEITDFSQNHEIEDHYFGSNIKLDMSKCIFVFSLNNVNLVDPILKDRLEIININGFNNKEKAIIMKDYLLPRELTEINLKYDFSENIIKYIITKVKEEKGVRNIQRALSKILRKLNVLQYYNSKKLSYKLKDNKKIKITRSLIDVLLKNDNPINPMVLKMYL